MHGIRLAQFKFHKLNHVSYTAGFICEFLICANYARCYKLANYNSTVTLNSANALHVSQTCSHVL